MAPNHRPLLPRVESVNDGINTALCSLQYTSEIEKISLALRTVGQSALMAKLDVKVAYRLIPVHPDERLLLDFECKGRP